MADPRFLAMRAGLVDRGFLTEELRLTAAGEAWVDEQLEQLRGAEAPYDRDGPRVRWNMKWRGAA